MAVSFYTLYPKDVFEFEWIVENFSFRPEVIRSPQFSPFPNSTERWYIKLKFIEWSECCGIDVFVVISGREFEQFTIKSEFYFCTITDLCIKSDTSFQRITGNEISYRLGVTTFCLRSKLTSLPGDKLKGKAKFTIAGHKVINKSTIINKLPALPAPPIQ
ncbi:hypothetical protein AVEN_247363-1 [Araneus ventricosus]|uniref:MATH domain-containing protein n=1 Tax=Araneus ventricosus TaxID=182803 RepID=A0A4Y2U692_ARAVE|nr:hypothetical protein AVEN_247363-1 [Araneus ventricosus]